jgi:hypothetical protein
MFERVAKVSGIDVIHTPYAAPRSNAIYECCVGRLRRECLDHMLVIGVLPLIRILKEYVSDFNQSRPHQGITQRIPAPTANVWKRSFLISMAATPSTVKQLPRAGQDSPMQIMTTVCAALSTSSALGFLSSSKVTP